VSERIERTGNSVIVYDDALLDHVDANAFAGPTDETDRSGTGALAGRGRTLFKTIGGRECVLRHYYRGGMIRRLSEDSFVWAGQERTRPFREWRLLAELQRRKLPVPIPVAARYIRRGLFYTADLITERLPGVDSLAVRLDAGTLSDDLWRNIGVTIARFHVQRVFHADLNAHNIQLDSEGRVYLLDFDRGRIMRNSGRWCGRNLQRLHRSLEKVCRESAGSFAERDWATLLAGYATP
jgi:3-deoxy-D-manno-octulosonic acid kinase